jgi:hypothetical protein
MRYIVKFGKQTVPGIDFPDSKSARAWADACFPNRPPCSVLGTKAAP